MTHPPDDLFERYEAWRDQASPEDPVPEAFAELAAGGALLRETLQAERESVPDAAFMAMWSRVQREIEQPPVPWWSRIFQGRAWRLPATAMAGVCAAALVWVVVQPEESQTDPGTAQFRAAPIPSKATAQPQLAQAPAAPQPPRQQADLLAEPADLAPTPTNALKADAEAEAAAQADIERVPAGPDAGPGIARIDFAQGGGRIDTIEHARGTTTVVWIDGPRKGTAAGQAMDL